MDDTSILGLVVNLLAGDNPRRPGRVDGAEADAGWWGWGPNFHCQSTLTVRGLGWNVLVQIYSVGG